MSENNSKQGSSQFPKNQGDVIRLLVLFEQQSQTQRYSVNNDIIQIKSANPQIRVNLEGKTKESYCLKMTCEK